MYMRVVASPIPTHMLIPTLTAHTLTYMYSHAHSYTLSGLYIVRLVILGSCVWRYVHVAVGDNYYQ